MSPDLGICLPQAVVSDGSSGPWALLHSSVHMGWAPIKQFKCMHACCDQVMLICSYAHGVVTCFICPKSATHAGMSLAWLRL